MTAPEASFLREQILPEEIIAACRNGRCKLYHRFLGPVMQVSEIPVSTGKEFISAKSSATG